jgi:zinc protease
MISIKVVLMTLSLVWLSACSTHEVTKETEGKIVFPQGITLVETVSAQANTINIPFKKYELTNGLTVILHQDNSDPLVHVDVTYHVGSAREQLGKSGFAHFF